MSRIETKKESAKEICLFCDYYWHLKYGWCEFGRVNERFDKVGAVVLYSYHVQDGQM